MQVVTFNCENFSTPPSRMSTPRRSNSTLSNGAKMDFLVRRRSFNLGHRDLDLSNTSITDSPLLTRRRSVSPLMSPLNGSVSHSIFERNRQAPNFPQTDDEQLYLFHEKILWNQERSLLPLAHDLADWLSGILGIKGIFLFSILPVLMITWKIFKIFFFYLNSRIEFTPRQFNWELTNRGSFVSVGQINWTESSDFHRCQNTSATHWSSPAKCPNRLIFFQR